ncbi:biotin/lipoyl-binding protein [Puia sp. P3]|uniref:biotin/lipoyl-binding protein n=1 Tax=Puia sp. P3 TaxID=3423952 RepID=UPI003D679150
MKKTLLIIIISVVVLVLILVLVKGLGKKDGTKVSSEKVVKRNITEIVTASGKVYPEKEVKISPDISGEVVDLKVTQEGDSVHKGQELARIYADVYTMQRDQAAAQDGPAGSAGLEYGRTTPGSQGVDGDRQEDL